MLLLTMRMTRGPHPKHPFPQDVPVRSELIGLATGLDLTSALRRIKSHEANQNSKSDIWALDLSLVSIAELPTVDKDVLVSSGVYIVENLEVAHEN